MKSLLRGCALALALLLPLAGASGARAPQKKRPNILLIVADDMGYADAGFHGCKDIPTPNLDALAKSGVRFTNGYVSGPYCSPTRAALLTGRYQQRFGHEFNPGGGMGSGGGRPGLPVTETTMGNRLRSVGYSTALIGKWHLGGAPRFHPNRRGFETFFGFLGGGNAYVGRPIDGVIPNILQNSEPWPEQEYLTDAFTREAVHFIGQQKNRPFFLYLSYNAVHTPMHATDERLKRFASIPDPQRRAYAAMLSAMDDGIGRVIARLRSDRLESNTLVVFHSDNGGPTMQGTTINGSRNDPLRGSKRQTLEGGIRVPFVLSWKGRLPAGKVYRQPVIQIDVLPTVLAAAGVAVKPQWKLDGVNLVPYVQGQKKQPPHQALYWRFGQMMAVRQGDWKLVRYDETPAKLYNLARDIGEANDLSNGQPEKVKTLQAMWDAWNRGNIPPLWGGARGPGGDE